MECSRSESLDPSPRRTRSDRCMLPSGEIMPKKQKQKPKAARTVDEHGRRILTPEQNAKRYRVGPPDPPAPAPATPAED